MAKSPLKVLGKDELIELFETLQDVSTALLKEEQPQRLLPLIVEKAMEIVDADGGSLYLKGTGDILNFEVLKNNSFKADGVDLEPIPLSTKAICTQCFHTLESLNINDAYLIDKELGISFNRSIDKEKGYRTRSVLAIPLVDDSKKAIGVLQMINKKNFYLEKWPKDSGDVSDMPPFGNLDLYLMEQFGALFSAAIMDSVLKMKK